MLNGIFKALKYYFCPSDRAEQGLRMCRDGKGLN